jgi:DNA-binding FadR family transcriptional regulator
LWDRIVPATLESLAPSERAAAVDREHRELIAAIAAGAPERAATAARAHVLATLAAVETSDIV